MAADCAVNGPGEAGRVRGSFRSLILKSREGIFKRGTSGWCRVNFFFLTLFLGLRGPSMAGPSGPGPASFWAPCLLEGASAAVLRGGPVLRPRCRSPRGRSRVFVLCGSAPPHLSSVGAHPPISAGVRGPKLLCALGFHSASPRLARFSSFRSGPAPLLSEASLLLTFFIYFFNFKHPRHLKGISSFFRSAGASSPCL